MKQNIILIFLLIQFLNGYSQSISIDSARSLPLGTIVTVTGIATNGAEFNNTRFIQDPTGGIALFGSAVSLVNRGDDVTATGTLIQYQNLLEIGTITNLTINSSGNALPASLNITPFQLDEDIESQIVVINNCTFNSPGGTFSGNSTHTFTSNGETGTVFVRTGTDLVGTTIPTGNIHITGLCSQFGNIYELNPRDLNDFTPGSSIYFTVQPSAVNITTASFDIYWTTNIAGSTFIEYGKTPLLELGILTGTGGSTSHFISISSTLPSEIYYARAYSVSGNDTAKSSVKVFITASNSSGEIISYFNRPVNHSVASSPSNFATHLNNAIDDTLAAYFDRCLLTLDIAIYSYDNNNTAVISQAINDAYNRGVQVRIIADGNNANSGLAALDPNIPVLLSPPGTGYYNIMHNKFAVMDAGDVNNAAVWTGSTNWSDNQLNDDANNVIIIRDQSLAAAYKMEFEEMWGNNGPLPLPGSAKFGPDKADNTPHEFMIGGKRVECYFSPPDNTNQKILESLASANSELYASLLIFTRIDLANEIALKINAGVYTAVMVDDSIGSSNSWNILQPLLGNNLMQYDHAGLPGILHHKYAIVDQSNPGSDPLVLTGSHNWSTSANSRNDENTVIVHDADIANQYYQEFVKRFNDQGNPLSVFDLYPSVLTETSFLVFPNPTKESLVISYWSLFEEKYDLKIIDITGRAIVEKTLTPKKGLNGEIISVTDLNEGIYNAVLENGSDRKVSTFSIVR